MSSGAVSDRPTSSAGLRARAVVGRSDRFTLDVEIAAAPGSVVAVLGPNGSGKTTLVRSLAGLQAIDDGVIRLGDEVLDDPATGAFVPTEARGVGVVFQDDLLFPHLSARDNVAFGPRVRGDGRAAARAAAGAWLDRVGLPGHHDARPRSLSGGEAQRVALARALAAEPRLLLLDEPLSALDVAVRVDIRHLLRTELARFAGIALLVTHDPVDALTLCDQVVVLEAGRVAQAGPIAEVVARPRSRHVADLIGQNLLIGRADGHEVTLAAGGSLTVADAADGEVCVLVAPRAVALHPRAPEGSARNAWRARVRSVELVGDRARVALAGPPDLVAEVTPAAVAELGLTSGAELWAAVKATELDVYPA